MIRIKELDTKKEFEDTIDTHYMMGYKLESHTGNKAMLKKGDNGNIIVHIVLAIFFWWLIFLPNLAYALYSRSQSDEVILKLKKDETDDNKNL